MIPVLEGNPFSSAVGKVVCIGRNYAAHAAELNNPVPSSPLLFIKPASAVCNMAGEWPVPDGQGAVHHELEVALLVGQRISSAQPDPLSAIAGVGLALDLTLRDVQDTLKKKGHPWERAKAFDGACPVSDFVAADRVNEWTDLHFSLHRNGQLQQQGHTANMLFPMAQLLSEIASVFTLEPGDIVLTGTPAGVGPLQAGDDLQATLMDWLDVSARVVSA